MMILLFLISLPIWDLWRMIQCPQLSLENGPMPSTLPALCGAVHHSTLWAPREAHHLTPVGNCTRASQRPRTSLLGTGLQPNSERVTSGRIAGRLRTRTVRAATAFWERPCVHPLRRHADPSVWPALPGTPAQSPSRCEAIMTASLVSPSNRKKRSQKEGERMG